MKIKIYEASVPCGPNQTLERVGLFTGNETSIRQWVSLKDGVYRPDQIELKSCEVIHMDERKLVVWQRIKQRADIALEELAAIENADAEAEY